MKNGTFLSRNRLTGLPAKAVKSRVTRLCGCRPDQQPGRAPRAASRSALPPNSPPPNGGRRRTGAASPLTAEGTPAKAGGRPGARVRGPGSPATGAALPSPAGPAGHAPAAASGGKRRQEREARAGGGRGPFPSARAALAEAPAKGGATGSFKGCAGRPRAEGSWRCRLVVPGLPVSEAGGLRTGRVAEPRLATPSPRFRRLRPLMPLRCSGAAFLEVLLNDRRYGARFRSPLKPAARPSAGKPQPAGREGAGSGWGGSPSAGSASRAPQRGRPEGSGRPAVPQGAGFPAKSSLLFPGPDPSQVEERRGCRQELGGCGGF